MAVTRSAFDLKGSQSRTSTSSSQRRFPDEVAVQPLLSAGFAMESLGYLNMKEDAATQCMGEQTKGSLTHWAVGERESFKTARFTRTGDDCSEHSRA